jgi:hypothetical protein
VGRSDLLRLLVGPTCRKRIAMDLTTLILVLRLLFVFEVWKSMLSLGRWLLAVSNDHPQNHAEENHGR